MANYTIKTMLPDGIELDFSTQNADVARAQMDGYFDFINYGTLTTHAYVPKAQEVEEPIEYEIQGEDGEKIEFSTQGFEATPLEVAEEIWQEQQEEIVDRFIEPLEVENEEAKAQSVSDTLNLLTQNVSNKALFDAFIVTAHYIKHDLKEECFTLKSLNGKLFEAAGRLIDYDIIIEGLNRKFLSIVEEGQGPARYTLNECGEEYYSKL